MMKYFLIIFSFIFVLSAVEAKAEKVILKYSENENIKVNFTTYQNTNGVFEARIDATGFPKALNLLNPTIAFGRDLDDDQKIDTWFFITDKGIKTIQAVGEDPKGLDILAGLIINKYPTSVKLYLDSAVTSVLSFLLLSAKEAQDLDHKYIYDWMDLEELRIRFERELESKNSTITREQMQFHYNLMSFGFSSLAKELDTFAKKDFWKWAGADVALWLSGAVVFRAAGAVLAKTGLIISDTAIFNLVKEKLGTSVTEQFNILKQKANEYSVKILPLKDKSNFIKSEAAFHLTKLNFRAVITSAIVAKVAKNRLYKVASFATRWTGKIITGARSEWKYIALNGSIQVSAETVTRWDDVYDPNPILMAKNIFTNEDILQNIGFMTADTILMTGISKNLTSMKARYLASGFIGLHDSAMINLVIKDDDNYKRIALDTGWEAIIGNAQVQVDLKALETFEKMAIKKNNPKLKLLGYAVVLVDQAAGYLVYSKASTKVENNNIKLIPVMAEVD